MNKQPSMYALTGQYHTVCLPGSKHCNLRGISVFLFLSLCMITFLSGFRKEQSSIVLPEKRALAYTTISTTVTPVKQAKRQKLFSFEYAGFIYCKVVITSADPEALFFANIDITTSIP
ncbi:hypothetical protein HB364_20540 [Pseudoflavitalea sp. X16]|uniref:hypothetical protein n=1 Tax=Paraflavitalea devenefica TaxID=2716334 RepID=UPI0014235694|nr:hypothetical protein [Paraflavitalea devenefica]NII27489.1 hypothetical protein [Paraflavitalea devenefica]